MLSGLDSALVLLAVLAGATGTWSPCGLSTIETLRADGVHRGRRVAAVASALAFAGGALAGALCTFGLLALLGVVAHTAADGLGPSFAVAIAVAAAALEASGARVFPQVRRQVPELWRRRLPIGLAAALYGALLGLGFTTFVMSFAVWALAGIAVALGALHVGLLIGLGFGLGRALPVVVLAPIADLEVGGRVLGTMTQRAWPLRGLRLADALALALCAVLLAAPAGASGGYLGRVDPSVAPGELAWQEPGVGGFVRIAGQTHRLPGEEPALGGRLIAWRTPGTIELGDRLTLAPLLSIPVSGADLLAVSDRWLVYRVPPAPGALDGLYELFAAPLQPPGEAVRVVAARAPSQVGRPALAGDTLVVHLATRTGSEIVAVNLSDGHWRVLRRARFAQLLNPSLAGGRLLYVRVDECRQRLLLGPEFARRGHRDRVLASRHTDLPRDGGYEPGAIREGRTPRHCVGPRARPGGRVLSYWTTALSPSTAFMTVLLRHGPRTVAKLVKVGRR